MIENHEYTAAHWGKRQADLYTQFLIDTAHEAADGEVFTKPLEGGASVRVAFGKWPRATYGHYIVSRPTKKGIFVLRVLHSSVDILSHLHES